MSERRKMDSLGWLLLNIIAIMGLAFFSMEEMAFVSFNKIRLQYFLSIGSKRAEWINYLISHPSRLFGTTLIGVNICMMLSSEFAREFHSSIGIDPDFAPISQIFLVIILGELAPQFAARKFSENVAMLGVPLVYASAKLMAPFIYILGLISKAANKMMGGKETSHELFLTLEELQKVLEGQDEEKATGQSEEFDTIVSNIFRLRNANAKKAMNPINEVFILPANTTIHQLRKNLKTFLPYIPIFHNQPGNIVGIVYIRDLVRASDTKKLRDLCRPPWFITENTPVMQLLKEFRHHNEVVACVLDKKGTPEGFIALDDILEDIFVKPKQKISTKVFVDVTVPANMTIEEFNLKFNAGISEEGCRTLADLFTKTLDHHPEEGETLYFPPYELTVKELTLLELKSIQVKTRI